MLHSLYFHKDPETKYIVSDMVDLLLVIADVIKTSRSPIISILQ